MTTLQRVIRIKATVKPEGQITVNDPALHSGDDVEVIILLPDREPDNGARSVVEILADTPGRRVFRTAAEVDRFLGEERNSWDS